MYETEYNKQGYLFLYRIANNEERESEPLEVLLKAAETLTTERYEQIFHQTFFTASTIILYNANPPSWQPGIFDAMFSNSIIGTVKS